MNVQTPSLSDRDVPVAKFLVQQLLVGKLEGDALGLLLREYVRYRDTSGERGCPNCNWFLWSLKARTNYFVQQNAILLHRFLSYLSQQGEPVVAVQGEPRSFGILILCFLLFIRAPSC